MAAPHDEYWLARDWKRSRERSRARARLALDLLGGRVPRPGDGSGGSRLLDAGCGPGWALEAFAAAGFEARGVDISSVAVEEARRRGLEADLLDLERDPIDGVYDVVVALEFLEHLAEPLVALVKLKEVLAGDGRLVVSLPNEFTLPARFCLVLGRPPFGGHDDPHLRHFNEKSARRLFDAAGLVVLGRLSDSVVPPRRRWLRRLSAPAVATLPGLFGLAHVFLLRRKETA